jgi:hypothetical protein
MLNSFSLQTLVEKFGVYLGIVSFFGFAILALLCFAQARDLRRLRELADSDEHDRSLDEIRFEVAALRRAHIAARKSVETGAFPGGAADASLRQANRGGLAGSDNAVSGVVGAITTQAGSGTPKPQPWKVAPGFSTTEHILATTAAAALKRHEVTATVSSNSPGPVESDQERPPNEGSQKTPASVNPVSQAIFPSGVDNSQRSSAESSTPVSSGVDNSQNKPVETLRPEAIVGARPTDVARGQDRSAAPLKDSDLGHGHASSSKGGHTSISSGSGRGAGNPPIDERSSIGTGGEHVRSAGRQRRQQVYRPGTASGKATNRDLDVPKRETSKTPSAKAVRHEPESADTGARTAPKRNQPRGGGAPKNRRRLFFLIGLVVVIVGGILAINSLASGGDSQPRPKKQTTKKPVARKTPSPARAKTKVAVLNGTTVSGLAGRVSDQLAKEGYAKGSTGNSADQQRATSIVLYGDGSRLQALEIAKSLKISDVGKIDAAIESQAGGDANVVVIIGADRSQ